MATVTQDFVSAPPGGDHQELSMLARVAGVLGLVQIVMMFGGITLEVMDDATTSPSTLLHDYATANLTRAFTGGYLEAVSFIVLVPELVIVGGVFWRGSQTARIAAATFVALGIVFVAATLAVGFAPGAAAMHGAHHGADAHSVAMLNDVRNYGYVLQVAIQGGMAVALGLAAVLTRMWPTLVGRAGVVVGAVVVVGTPFAQDALGMVWLLWWLVVLVLLVRGRLPRA